MIGNSEAADAVPRFVDSCLAAVNLQRRLSNELRGLIHATMWSCAERLAGLKPCTNLVHGDFGKRNLLVNEKQGCWAVAAVLDWEFAFAGSPLVDIGHFLRYEKVSRPLAEPQFSNGYQDGGGELPEDWRRLARVLDLAAVCQSLTQDDLPEAVVYELRALAEAAAENSDPPAL